MFFFTLQISVYKQGNKVTKVTFRIENNQFFEISNISYMPAF